MLPVLPWPLRWGVRAGLLGLVLWFAWARVTTPPAAGWPEDGPGGAESDDFERRAYALPLPPAKPGGPTGVIGTVYWAGEDNVVGRALHGPWAPDSDADQQAALAYVDANLADLRRLGRSAREQSGRPTGYFGAWMVDPLAVAGRRAAAEADLAAAAELLADAIAIERRITRAATMYRPRPGFGDVALRETMLLAIEHDLPPAVAHDLNELVGRAYPQTLSQALTEQLKLDLTQVEDLLDRFYTHDKDGDGWLVVNVALQETSQRWWWTGTPDAPTSRWWNLTAPLFAGRAAVRARLADIAAQLEGIDDLALANVHTRLYHIRSQADMRASDGPLLLACQRLDNIDLSSLGWQVELGRVTRIVLALSAFRQVHGAYPAALSELAPDFIDPLPASPASGSPFAYERLDDGAYTLKRGHSEWPTVSWAGPRFGDFASLVPERPGNSAASQPVAAAEPAP